MTTGERIRARRKSIGMSADVLAEKLGVSRTTVFRYENGYIEKVPLKYLEPIAKELNTTIEYLMGWSENDSAASSNLELYGIRKVQMKKLPVLGEIACGKPVFAEERQFAIESDNADEDADYCLVAKGDSMINLGIKDGTIVFVKKQPIVENGEVAIVIVGDEATMKRVYYYKDKNLLILRSENSKYPDMIYQGQELENVEIIGKALSFKNKIQ